MSDFSIATCDWMEWRVSATDRCPECGSAIVEAHLPTETKVFYCGAQTRRNVVVVSCKTLTPERIAKLRLRRRRRGRG